MSNCQDNPTWSDIHKDGCDYYNKFPNLCNQAEEYKDINGVSATTSCCVCRSTVVKPKEIDAKAYQTYKPCPEEQLWGDLDESGYLEVGKADCPKGIHCPRNTFSWVSGMEESIIQGPAKQGCWISGNTTEEPVFTCGEDNYCKNLDLYNSEPGNLVYRCPNATCSIGECNCGPECIQDNRTKLCVPPTDTPTPMSSLEESIPIPHNTCTIAQIDNDSFVCWKLEGNYILNCDPGFCGMGDKIVKGFIKLAGTDITIYGNKYEETSIPYKTYNDDLDSPLLIIVYIFSAIILLILLFLFFKNYFKPLVDTKFNRKFNRKRRFG